MTEKEYQQQLEELRHQVEVLQKANIDLMNRNIQLGQHVDAYYDVRRRIQMLKELVIRHKELNPDFGLKELAEFIGTSQTRIIDLFRRSIVHKNVDDYLDYLRLLRSMYYIQSKPQWGIAACAQQAGFSVIRTFNRKFQDALGMTPHEFRMIIESNQNNETK